MESNSPQFSVSKIVLGAKTDGAFKWLQTNTFSTGLVILCCQQKIFVSKGKSLVLPSTPLLTKDSFYEGIWNDIVVLDSVPVKHGYLTVNTEVVITRTSSSKQEDVAEETPEEFNPVFVSDFLSCARDPRCVLPRQRGSHVTFEPPEKNNPPFNEVQLEVIHSVSSFTSFFSARQSCDVFNTILVNRATAQKLGLFNGCYVEIKFQSKQPTLSRMQSSTQLMANNHAQNKSKKDSKCGVKNNPKPSRPTFKVPRIAQVYLQDSSSPSRLSHVFMLPYLWFHMLHRSGNLHSEVQSACVLRVSGSMVIPSASLSDSWKTTCLYMN